MDVYLVDGTYELFRHFFAIPLSTNSEGEEVAATRGVLGSVVQMLESGVTHIGVATDHVIESFRNDLWPGYKTSEGVDPLLLSQFQPLEDALQAMGVMVWPMIELEADDALAGAASSLSRTRRVGRIYLCSPDKDLAQCVRNDRIVMLDRRRDKMINEEGVIEKFGVSPESIPDFLALVGDSADGYPGVEGWGEKSAATVLARYKHLEKIPRDETDWEVKTRSADRLARTLQNKMKLVMLFRNLATLRTEEPRIGSVEELRWRGPKESFAEVAKRLEASELYDRVSKLAKSRMNSNE